MKTLIVYYSLGGFTKSMAKKIAERTGADLLALHPVKEYPKSGAKSFLLGGKAAVFGDKPRLQPYVFNADRYDHIVFGSPVWASSFTPPIRTFVEENRDKLKDKKISAFFCQKGNGAEKAANKLLKLIGFTGYDFSVTFTEPNEKHPSNVNDAMLEIAEQGLAQRKEND